MTNAAETRRRPSAAFAETPCCSPGLSMRVRSSVSPVQSQSSCNKPQPAEHAAARTRSRRHYPSFGLGRTDDLDALRSADTVERQGNVVVHERRNAVTGERAHDFDAPILGTRLIASGYQ